MPEIVVQFALFKNLKEKVEHVRVRLFNFIKKNYGIRMTAHLFRKNSAVLVADVSRRSTDKTRRIVLFHKVRHIYSDKLGVASEHKFCKRLCKLRFSDACRTKKNKRTYRMLWRGNSCTASADSPGNSADSFILSYYHTVHLIFHFYKAR